MNQHAIQCMHCGAALDCAARPVWCGAIIDMPHICATCAVELVRILNSHVAAAEFMAKVQANVSLAYGPIAGSA